MILEDIVKTTRLRVIEEKDALPFTMLESLVNRIAVKKDFPFETALKKEGLHAICEVKKASPSKGILAYEFPYVEIAKEYESAGASCISVLTEPHYFLGHRKYLSEIKANVTIPVLRKDFIIDSYQIYESKLLGADCILLIVSILSEEELMEYLTLCEKLGLSALVEAHTEEEVLRALSVGARIIGVNNRNLSNFKVDMNHSLSLRKLIPQSTLFVSESGIKTAEDVQLCRNNHVNAVLIGETLMKAKDKKKMLAELMEESSLQ